VEVDVVLEAGSLDREEEEMVVVEVAVVRLVTEPMVEESVVDDSVEYLKEVV
jgi:hypothetical protein